MPQVIPFDDDQAATSLALGGHQEFAPQQHRAQQHETLDIDLNVREEGAQVFVNSDEPFAHVKPIGQGHRGDRLRANEVVDHEEGGERSGLMSPLGARNEVLDAPAGGASMAGFGRDPQASPQCGKAASWDAGETGDRVGADLAAQKVSRERKGAKFAVDGIRWRG